MIDPQQALTYLNALKQYRINYEPDWYRNFFAYENNSFVSYSRNSQTLIRPSYRKQSFMNLPETKKQSDSFENLLLMFMPLFVIYPPDISDKQGVSDAADLSKFIQQKYMGWDSKNLIHQYVHLAIKYPVSFFEICIENVLDPVTKQVKKDIVPHIGDAFDWYFDPRINFQDNQIVVKVIRKTLHNLKEFKQFKAPKTGSPAAYEDMKEMILTSKFGPRAEIGDLKTVEVYQFFEKTNEGIEMMIIDNTGNVLNKATYKGMTFYPVVPLHLDSGDIYGPSFVQNMIPINRSISVIANRMEQLYLKVTKGQYLVPDGTDVSFSDENNTVVKYEGEAPTVMPVPQVQSTLLDWFNNLFNIAERYGINYIAMGGVSNKSNQRSAKQGDQAIKNQQLQQKTPLDSLVSAFQQIAEITMYYMSELTDEPVTLTLKSDNTDMVTKSFIGEKWSDKSPNSIKIPHTVKQMEVQIEDISNASILNKREAVFELAKEFTSIAPPFQKVLLDLYKVGPTSDIMDDYEKSQTLLDSPEFQNLIKQAKAGQLPPQEVQALATLLKFLSQTAPVPDPEKQGVPPVGGQPAPIGGQPQQQTQPQPQGQAPQQPTMGK